MAIVVVSDTSPIRALACLGLLGSISAIFERVLVPPAVVAELAAAAPGVVRVDIGAHPFMTVRAPLDTAPAATHRPSLGPGEIEAIALALEVRANFVLIDEAAGRRVAVQLGLQPVGVLGILAQLRRAGVIPAVGPLIEKLQLELEFRLSRQIIRAVLDDLGEQ